MTSGRLVIHANHLAFILASLLLMALFGFVPFSNTLPDVTLIFLSMGMMQRDGGSIVPGYAAHVGTIIYFSFLITAGGLTVQQLFQFLN